MCSEFWKISGGQSGSEREEAEAKPESLGWETTMHIMGWAHALLHWTKHIDCPTPKANAGDTVDLG